MNEYVYVKLLAIPSINNTDTNMILCKVNTLFRKFDKQLKLFKEKKVIKQDKLAFYTYLSKKIISFYAIVPKIFYSEFESVCENVWKGINLVVVDELPGNFEKEYMVSSVSTKKSDALSLRVDKRDNFLLASTLSTVNILNDNEEAGVLYNFIPTSSSTRKNDRAKFKEDIVKLENNYNVDKNKSVFSHVKNGLKLGIHYILDVVEDTARDFGVKMDVSASDKDIYKEEISDVTKKKLKADYVHTQILVMSKSSEGKSREKTINEYICDNFDKVSQDNEFEYKHNRGYKKIDKFDFTKYKYPFPINVLSTEECQHLVSLPGSGLMKEYKMIENMPSKQFEIPEVATQGYLSIGRANNRGNVKDLKFPVGNADILTKGIYILGPQGTYKSTFLKRYICDAVMHEDLVVVFDYIGINEFATDLDRLLPSENKEIIDLSEYEGLNAQALAINELDVSKIKRSDYETEKEYKEAFMSAVADYSDAITKMIETLNGDGVGKSLSSKMRGILKIAGIINYSYPNSTIKDLYRTIVDHEFRHKRLTGLPDFIKNDYKDELKKLSTDLDLIKYIANEDGVKIPTVVGTQDSSITFLLDRFEVLTYNRQIKKMIEKDPKDNIDFSDLFLNSKAKVIIIKVPDDAFNDQAKDIVCNFFANKILYAMKKRYSKYVKLNPDDSKATKMTLAHIIFDEAYLIEDTMRELIKYFTQFRKYRFKPVLTGHYISQLSKDVADSMIGSGFNFIITGELEQGQYEKLSSNFQDFTYEDCNNLLQGNYMVSLKYADGKRRNFITETYYDVTETGHKIFEKNKQNSYSK